MSGQRSTGMVLKASIAYAIACVFGLFAMNRLVGPLAYFKSGAPAGILTGADPLTGVFMGLGVGVVGALAGELITRNTRWGETLTRIIRQLLGELHLGDALLLAALSALGEEILFRGLLLPYTGIIGSSAIFGFAHLLPRRRLWLWSVWATAAGLAFAWLATSTGSILAPTVAHFAINLVGLISLSKRRGA